MCYDKIMDNRRNGRHKAQRTVHRLIPCDHHDKNKYGHVFTFKMCQLFEIPVDKNINAKGFEMLCIKHYERREAILDWKLDIKLGIQTVSTHPSASEQLKDLSMDNDRRGMIK